MPVEEILESHLGLDLRLDGLQARSGDRSRLGEISILGRQVAIDESLDPTVYPEHEGRYRFTVGHEVGHWELHRHLVASAGQLSLVAEAAKTSIVCRAGRSSDPKEWQANQFSAYLLMPQDLVFQAWRDLQGNTDPYIAVEEIVDLSARWCLGEDETPTVGIARKLAQTFGVSGQAMQIRLTGLKLVCISALAPSLF